jgi:hypothetical protein
VITDGVWPGGCHDALATRIVERAWRPRELAEFPRREKLERVAIIVRLKPDAETRAAELISTGPPFDPDASGFERHTVFLSATEVMFVFEAHEVEWLVDALVDEPFQWMLAEAIDAWRPLVDGPPRIAREVFAWARHSAEQAG